VLTEHFGNTSGDPNIWYGRHGLMPASDWDAAIQVRQDAIYAVGFAGFLAYAWGGNGMGITEAEQIQHEYYYRTRLVLPGQQPQWLPDAEYTIGDAATPVPLSWNQPLNWLGSGVVNGVPNSVPNSPGAVANFFRTNTAARTITLDGNKTIGTLSFDSPFSYSISAGTGGSLFFNKSGGPADLKSNQGSHTIAVGVQLTSALNATINSGTLTISGAVSGAGGLAKYGAGTLSLTATNSYSGNTTVEAGKLSLTNRGLADGADVWISTGGTLDLKFSGSPDVIDSLFLNGISQPVGIWGAPGSGAQFTSSLLLGTGVLQITTYVPSFLAGDYNSNGIVDAADYDAWRANYGAANIANRSPQIPGPIGAADYVMWRAHLGDMVGSGTGTGLSGAETAVPEPATLTALVVATSLVGLARRARRRSATSATSR
jgi:autotransporter-associated beta strand protein